MRRTLSGLAVAVAVFAAPGPMVAQETAVEETAARELAPTVSAVIAQVQEDLDAIRGALRDVEDAPEDGWFTIWDKDSYRGDLNGYLDDAFELIAPDFYRDRKARLAELDEAIEKAQAERSEFVVQRLGAAPAAGGPSLVDRAMGRAHPQGSLEDIDAQLARIDAAVRDLEAERVALIGEFKRSLEERFDIDLSIEQAEAALYQVNGSSMIESAIVAEVLTAIEQRLREIVEHDLDARVARRYYGVAAVTRLMIVRMHERHLADYGEVWLPRLDELAAENRALIEETTRALDAADTGARRAALENNLGIQRQIEDTIAQYRAILEERRDATLASLRMAEGDAMVAVNTLKTLESAAQLSDVMTETLEEFHRLMAVEPPALLQLDDQQMFDQFLSISRQLEASS